MLSGSTVNLATTKLMRHTLPGPGCCASNLSLHDLSIRRRNAQINRQSRSGCCHGTRCRGRCQKAHAEGKLGPEHFPVPAVRSSQLSKYLTSSEGECRHLHSPNVGSWFERANQSTVQFTVTGNLLTPSYSFL